MNDSSNWQFTKGFIEYSGPGSVVGIATGYGLDGPGIESRCGVRFLAHVQTGSGAHPASCTMGTGSFPGVKSGRGHERVPLVPLWAVRPVQRLSACTRVTFTFFLLFMEYSYFKPKWNKNFGQTSLKIMHCWQTHLRPIHT